MKILPLPDAIQLYLLIRPYLPKNPKEYAPIDFIRQLVDNMIQANKPKAYLEAVSIMSNIPVIMLIRKTPNDVLNMCIDGMKKNFILELIDFCQKIGL